MTRDMSDDTIEDKAGDTNDDCPCKQYIAEAQIICCENCQVWYHIECVRLGGLNEKQIKSIKHYECPFCIVSAGVLLPPSKHEINNTDYQHLKQAVARTIKETIKNELSCIMEKTKVDIVTESSKAVKSYVDVVKTEVKTAIDQKPPTQLVRDTVRQIDADAIERVKRECNVIINQVPEQTTNGQNLRESDMDFLTSVCGMSDNEIVTCFRAGKIPTSGDAQAVPRPLVVKMDSKETAMYWCDYGKGYRISCIDDSDDEKKKCFWINQDLCRADREAQFFLREERRRRVAEKAKAAHRT